MRKGQVTIFIIMGIVLLFGIVIFFYIRDLEVDVGEEGRPVIERTPIEFKPIENFVDLCIIKTTEDALRVLGQHGGYIDTTEAGLSSNPSQPTEGNALRFFPTEGNSEVAYWHYFASDNECTGDCSCASERPPLVRDEGEHSIQEQLEEFVNDNLYRCLDDFSTFRQQGFTINARGRVDTTVTFAETDLDVFVTYPLEIIRQDSREAIDQFSVRLPIDFRRIYEIATELAKAHQDNHYIEWWTQEQIDTFGLGIDPNKLPPTAFSVFDPSAGAVVWSKNAVRDSIQKNMLPVYTPFLQVYGTRNFEYRTEDFYERAYLPIASPTNDTYHTLEVGFEYLNWWPIYFDITGRGINGDRIGPEKVSVPFFSFLGINRYEYYYDVSFPVRVKITDTLALNRDGYDFYIGLESNIRNNKPLNCTVADFNYFVPGGNSLLCDPSHACADVTVNVKDAVTGDPVQTFVSYGSFDEMCAVGNSNELLSLPQCIGPGCSMSVETQGYYGSAETYSVLCNPSPTCSQDSVLCDGETLELEAEPYRHPKFVVKKKRMVKSNPLLTGLAAWQLDSTEMDLSPDETAIIYLEKQVTGNEPDLILTQQYNGEPVEVQPGIVPGTYDARVQLLYNLPDSSGRTEIVFEGDPALNISDQPITGSQIVTGGSVFELVVTPAQLDGADTITLIAISAPDVSQFDVLTHRDAVLMGKTDDLSQTYQFNIRPRVE